MLQFGGGTIGHPMGIAAGATANRVAVEAMIKARNEGRDYLARGRAASWPTRPSAASRCRRPWTPGVTSRFNYESTDTPDVVATPSA